MLNLIFFVYVVWLQPYRGGGGGGLSTLYFEICNNPLFIGKSKNACHIHVQYKQNICGGNVQPINVWYIFVHPVVSINVSGYQIHVDLCIYVFCSCGVNFDPYAHSSPNQSTVVRSSKDLYWLKAINPKTMVHNSKPDRPHNRATFTALRFWTVYFGNRIGRVVIALTHSPGNEINIAANLCQLTIVMKTHNTSHSSLPAGTSTYLRCGRRGLDSFRHPF